MSITFVGIVSEARRNLRCGLTVAHPKGWLASSKYVRNVAVGDIVHVIQHPEIVLEDGGDKLASLIQHRYTEVFTGGGRLISRSGSWKSWRKPKGNPNDFCWHCGTDNGRPGAISEQGYCIRCKDN